MPNLVVPEFENLTREEFWSSFIAANDLRHLAEIGVWRGGFASYLLRHCGCIESYTMVDAWRNLPNWNKPFNVDQNEFNAVFKEAMNATDFAAAKRIVKRGTTLEVISEIPDRSLDFIYVDGDHTLRGVVIDLLAAWGKVREGGVLAGDDFTNSIWQHGDSFEPTMVNPFALYFAEATNSPITILPHNQFFIHKDSHASHSVTNLSGAELNHSLRSLSSALTNSVQPASFPRHIVKFARKGLNSFLWRTSKSYREWVHVRRTGQEFPSMIKETGLLFIHIPKSAGSSISLSLYGRSLGHKKLSEWLYEYPKSVQKLKIFSVIRHPIERFISAFWFLKSGGMNEMDFQFAEKYLSKMQTPDDLAKYLMNPGVSSEILSYWHFIPQIDFISETNVDKLSCRLFLFEEIAGLQNWLASECPKPIRISKINESKNKIKEYSLQPDSQTIVEAIYQKDMNLYLKIQQAGGVL